MRRFVLAAAVAIIAFGSTLPAVALASPLAADGMPRLHDGINLSVPGSFKSGQDVEATATLIYAGVPVVDADVHFVIDGIERRIERTDSTGTTRFSLRGVLAAGKHELDAVYKGDRRRADAVHPVPASATASFLVTPLELKVQTVPALPGIVMVLDKDQEFVSDRSGLGTTEVATAGIHTLSVRLPAPTPKTRITFARWSDDSWAQTRALRIVDDVSIAVGLRVAYLTELRFIGLDGKPLAPERVSDVVLSGPDAEVLKPSYPFEPIWLQTPLPAKHSGESGLHITPAPYSVSYASYDGIGVASQGQVRYAPTEGGTWNIRLLLFTLHLQARDALFGNPLQLPLSLIGPTGKRQIIELDPSGRQTLVLSRGNYAAQAIAPGVAPISAVALSRSQSAVVLLVTPADLLVLGLATVFVFAGLFLAGRGRRWLPAAAGLARRSRPW